MSVLRNRSRFFAIALLAIMIVTVTAAQMPAAASQQLSAGQEVATVGAGFWCDFNDGVSAGLGIAFLFGCAACGVGTAIGAVIHVVAC